MRFWIAAFLLLLVIAPLTPAATGQITTTTMHDLTELTHYGRGNVRDAAWIDDNTLLVGTTAGMWVYTLDDSREPYVIENRVSRYDFEMTVNESLVAAVTCAAHVNSVCEQYGVSVWDITSGAVVRRSDEVFTEPPHIAFGGGNTNLLVIGNPGTVRLWDVDTGDVIQTFNAAYSILQVGFSTDENKIWVASSWGASVALSMFGRDGREIYNNDTPSYVDHDPDLTKVAAFTWNAHNEIAVMPTEGGSTPITFIPGGWQNEREAWRAAFSPDGNWLAVGSLTGKLIVQDLTTNTQVLTIENASNSLIQALSFSPDQTKIAVVSLGQVNIWSMTGEKLSSIVLSGENWKILPLLATKPIPESELTDFAEQYWHTLATNLAEHQNDSVLFPPLVYSPKLTWMVTLGAESVVHLFNGATGEWMRQIALDQPQYSAAFSPDESILALGSANGVVSLWDISSGESLGSLVIEGATRPIYNLVFSPDGKLLIVGYPRNIIRIWDVAQRQVVDSFEYPIQKNYERIQLAVSADSSLLAYGETVIRLYDLQNQTDLAVELDGWHVLSDLAFSPDDSLLVFTDHTSRLHLWDWQSRQISHYAYENSTLLNIAFSPDGTRLFAGSDDYNIIEWGLSTR